MRLTFFSSPPVISASRLRRRLRVEDFFSNRWFLKALRRVIRPVPVTLKRFLAPVSVFILGIGASGLLAGRDGGGPAGGGVGAVGLGGGLRLLRGAAVGCRCLALVTSLWVLRRLGGRRLGPLVGGQHHDHVAAVELRE